jgi:hypothetical protein
MVLVSSKYVSSNNETESLKNTTPMAVFASVWKFPLINCDEVSRKLIGLWPTRRRRNFDLHLPSPVLLEVQTALSGRMVLQILSSFRVAT